MRTVPSAENMFATLKPEILKLSSYHAGHNSLKYVQEKIFRVIATNAKLTNHPGFWFKQEYFGNSVIGVSTRNHLLHKDLKDEMENVYSERSEIISDIAKATMYCKFALRCASTLGEYVSLLPDEFGKNISTAIQNAIGLISIDTKYPPEFIEAFKAKYSDEETALKNQLVYNLLQG